MSPPSPARRCSGHRGEGPVTRAVSDQVCVGTHDTNLNPVKIVSVLLTSERQRTSRVTPEPDPLIGPVTPYGGTTPYHILDIFQSGSCSLSQSHSGQSIENRSVS